MKNLFTKVILMILMLTMLVSVGITVNAKEYPDEGYWANEAIDAAIANGLLQGKGNGNIDSEANLTRAEMAAIMVRAFGASVSANVNQYIDLDPSAWYYGSFAKAVQMRVFEGDGTGHMRPNDNITREEVFTVVARALVLSDSDHSSLNKFVDANKISGWAKNYMSILTQKGYVNGDNLGNVNPQKYITRAEFAQLMHNIFKKYYSQVGTYENLNESSSVMINTEGVNLKNVTIEGDLIIGDGANLSTIILENVDIKGRLVVRGSAQVKIIKSTVGENVVVNNYNSVVHFDNYRSEVVFDGINMNTEATFKKTVSGGGGGSGGSGGYVPPANPQYVVEYYIENIDGSYAIHHTIPAKTVTAGQSVTADTTLNIPEGFEYNPTNTLNYVSAVAPSTGTLTLKVYYDRIKYQYTVEYYQQNVDNLNYYDKVESVTVNSKYGLTVSADKKEDKYPYFDLNTTKSEHWTGVVPGCNDLVLKVYYDREKYEINFNYGNEYPGAAATPVTVVYGQKVYTLLPQPEEWLGHYLEGWYDGAIKVDVNYTVPGTSTGKIQLDAKWVDGIAYKVVYYLQDVDSDSYTQTYTETIPSTVGAQIKLGINDLTSIQGFEYAKNANEDLDGVVSETEALTLHVYYNRKIVSYTVEYYEERVSLDGYDSTPFKVESGSGKYGAKVEAAVVNHPGFVKNDSKGTLDGIIPVNDNELVLKVYYDRETFDYKIKYYQQNVEQNGYVEVTKDTITGKQEYGTSLEADTSVEYEGFVLNTSDNDEWSAAIPANNDLVLKVFYDRGIFDYTVVYHIEDWNGTEFKITETKKDVFGKEVSIIPEDRTGFEVNKNKSTTEGIVTADGKLVLEVYYDRIRSDVTFDGNGYTEDIAPLKDVMYGTKIYGLLPTIEREGFVLEGWYDDNGTKIDSTYVLVKDVTLTAKWEPADAIYYVVYHMEGEAVGSYSDKDIYKVQKGSETGATVNADIINIEGYEYAPHNNEKLSDIIPETGILELHVYYKRATFNYTVKTRVENIDGTYTESSVTKQGRYYTTVTETPNPATGFETNTTVSLLSGVVKEDGSLELVVQYDRSKFYYTIRHMMQDVDLDGHNIIAYQQEKYGKFETEVSADTTKKYTGFVLNETKNTDAELKGKIPAEDYKLVLNVYYDREKYTVTYNTDGGTAINDDTAYYGVDFVLPGKNSTTKTGWALKSWTVNGKEYTPGTTVSRIAADTTAIANWERETYTITFDVVGGTVIPADKAYYGLDYVLPGKDSTTKSGWILTGWNVNGVEYAPGATVSRIAADTTAIAIWERETYIITFDVVGGTVIPADKAYYGLDYVLPGKDSTTKSGWILTGWNVNGVEYAPGATVSGISGDTVITAVWEEETPGTKYGSYIIEYYKQNAAGGYDYVESDTPVSMVVGSHVISPATDKYDGYVLNTTYDYTVVIVEDETTTLKVYYDIKSDDVEYVTVTFYNFKDQVVDTIELVSGNSMADENKNMPSYTRSKNGYVKDNVIPDFYKGDKSYTHTVNWSWYFNPTTKKYEPFTEDTKVEANTDVYSRVRKFAAWVYNDVKPDGFPFDAYYEADTRFADTLKDILYSDTPLEALELTGYWDTVKEKLVGFELLNSIDEDDNIQMQHIPVKFVQVIGEDKLEDYIVDSAKDMFGGEENQALTDAFVTYLETAYNSGSEEKVKEITGLMVNTIDHILDTDPSTIEELCRDILETVDENGEHVAFKEITGYDYDDLPTDVREFAVEYIAKELSTNEDLLKEVVKAYAGKEYDELSEDPKKLVVELTSGALDNVDTLEGLIEDMADVEVEITDNMTIKQLFVKIAETKLASDDTFLEDAIAEILGEGITVSIKDENDNYKTIQNYLAEIAVSKLGATENSTLFEDVVKDYIKTDITTEGMSIREFFVEVAKEDLNKAQSKLLKSFVSEFVGYDITIDDSTTTKEFFVNAIIAKLENEVEFFDEVTVEVLGIKYSTLDSDIQDDARKLISVAIENELNTDADAYDNAVETMFDGNALPDNTTDVVLAFVAYRLMTDDDYFGSVIGATPDEATREAEVQNYIASIVAGNDYSLLKGFDVDDYSTNPDEAFIQLVKNEVQVNNVAFEKLTGYTVADVEDKTGKEFITEQANAKLNDAADTYLSDLVRDKLGYELAALSPNAKEMIAEIADDKLTNASNDELDSTITKLGYDFTIENWSGDAKDEILKVVEKEFKADSDKLEEAMTNVNIDVTINSWNDDAKTTVITNAKVMLEKDDNVYLNKVVTQLNIPSSITSDWSKDAKAAVKTYAEDKLDTDKEFFKEITGYYPSELEGKTKKDVLISIVKTQLATNNNLFETATGWKVDELPATAADFMIETVLRELKDPESPMRHQIEEKAVDYLLNHHDDLVKAADLAMVYLNDHPDERDEIVDTIIEELYRKDLDKLIYQLVNEDKFEINANTEFIAEGLKIKIEEDYSYEKLIGSRIPEKVFEIYPEEKLMDIYNHAYNNLITQIDDAIVKAKNGETGYIDTGVTVIFNPVDDFYTPLYERLLELVKEKGEDNQYYFYYEDNEYLQEFIKLLSTESLFEGSIDKETEILSGYKLRSLDEYYELVKKLVFLGDDAILWYYNSDVVDDIEKVIDSHQKLILKYVNATADTLDRYAKDGTLPNQKLSPIEEAFKKRYPKIVNEVVAWYKDSDINKDYNDEDFQKVQDKVRDAFEKINLTTDEYFDKILGFDKLQEAERLDKYFEKISEDEYKFEAKGNIVTFLREIVDA